MSIIQGRVVGATNPLPSGRNCHNMAFFLARIFSVG
ncbi:hypothetical protein LINPERHAP2_LOCUS202 [Linum perenne]